MHVCSRNQSVGGIFPSTRQERLSIDMTVCLACDHVLWSLGTQPNATLRLFLSDDEQHKVSEQNVCLCLASCSLSPPMFQNAALALM